MFERTVFGRARSSEAFMLAKPFIKWAGGKGQLLKTIANHLPQDLKRGRIDTYIEPFIGGGAVFFHIAQNYNIERFYLFDINEELVLVYRVVQRDVEALVECLAQLQATYWRLSFPQRKEFFYHIRQRYNGGRSRVRFDAYHSDWIERAAQFIFLNRTCYNGLFRVNSRAEFNVPFGRYKRPQICFADNLRQACRLLRRSHIAYADFTDCAERANESTFIYFDPPYRPISATARFTAYSTHIFDDGEQIRLAEFFRQLHQRGAKLLLSNSDPRNIDPEDDFFDRAYAGFHIERVKANRAINSSACKRGSINELLIFNYLSD